MRTNVSAQFQIGDSSLDIKGIGQTLSKMHQYLTEQQARVDSEDSNDLFDLLLAVEECQANMKKFNDGLAKALSQPQSTYSVGMSIAPKEL